MLRPLFIAAFGLRWAQLPSNAREGIVSTHTEAELLSNDYLHACVGMDHIARAIDTLKTIQATNPTFNPSWIIGLLDAPELIEPMAEAVAKAHPESVEKIRGQDQQIFDRPSQESFMRAFLMFRHSGGTNIRTILSDCTTLDQAIHRLQEILPQHLEQLPRLQEPPNMEDSETHYPEIRQQIAASRKASPTLDAFFSKPPEHLRQTIHNLTIEPAHLRTRSSAERKPLEAIEPSPRIHPQNGITTYRLLNPRGEVETHFTGMDR